MNEPTIVIEVVRNKEAMTRDFRWRWTALTTLNGITRSTSGVAPTRLAAEHNAEIASSGLLGTIKHETQVTS